MWPLRFLAPACRPLNFVRFCGYQTRDGIQGSGPAEEDGQMPANLAFGNAGEMDDDNGAGELESLPNRLGKSTEGRNRLDVRCPGSL